MPSHSNAVHHREIRKRIYKKHEQFPHPRRSIKLLDDLVFVMAFLSPLFTFPQAFRIWQEKAAEGISLLTWSTYLVGSVIWFIYGIVHKEKPILIANFLYIIVNILIVVGAMIYR